MFAFVCARARRRRRRGETDRAPRAIAKPSSESPNCTFGHSARTDFLADFHFFRIRRFKRR